MIKLYNNSKLSSEVLTRIIKQVMKDLGMNWKKRDIVILIKKGWRGGGSMSICDFIKGKKVGSKVPWIKTDLGFIVINPRIPQTLDNCMTGATHTYNTILHELKHSYDYYIGKLRFDSHKVPYRKRVQEVSAYWYVKYEAKYNPTLLLDLTLDIQRVVEKGDKR